MNKKIEIEDIDRDKVVSFCEECAEDTSNYFLEKLISGFDGDVNSSIIEAAMANYLHRKISFFCICLIQKRIKADTKKLFELLDEPDKEGVGRLVEQLKEEMEEYSAKELYCGHYRKLLDYINEYFSIIFAEDEKK